MNPLEQWPVDPNTTQVDLGGFLSEFGLRLGLLLRGACVLLAMDPRFELDLLLVSLKQFQILVCLCLVTFACQLRHCLRFHQLSGLCNSAAFPWCFENSINSLRLAKVCRSALANPLWSTLGFLRRICVFGASILFLRLLRFRRVRRGWTTCTWSLFSCLRRGWTTCSLFAPLGSSAWWRDFIGQAHSYENSLPAKVVLVVFPEC